MGYLGNAHCYGLGFRGTRRVGDSSGLTDKHRGEDLPRFGPRRGNLLLLVCSLIDNEGYMARRVV